MGREVAERRSEGAGTVPRMASPSGRAHGDNCRREQAMGGRGPPVYEFQTPAGDLPWTWSARSGTIPPRRDTFDPRDLAATSASTRGTTILGAGVLRVRRRRVAASSGLEGPVTSSTSSTSARDGRPHSREGGGHLAERDHPRAQGSNGDQLTEVTGTGRKRARSGYARRARHLGGDHRLRHEPLPSPSARRTEARGLHR